MGTLRYTVSLALGILLPLAVQWWDRRRLSAEQRAGAWNAASWASALAGFGPLSMLGWCWVTRQEARRWRARGVGVLVLRSAALIALGVLATAAVALVIVGVDELIAWLADAPTLPAPTKAPGRR